jgi:hypothetical protein
MTPPPLRSFSVQPIPENKKEKKKKKENKGRKTPQPGLPGGKPPILRRYSHF